MALHLHQPPTHRLVRDLSFGLAALLLAACAVGPAATPTPTATPTASPTSVAWPRTLTDDEGTTLTLETPPQRIVSLSPANTEIVFALGAGDRLLGGTDYDDYPPEASGLTHVATFSGVLIEQVVDLAPDLVLAAGAGFNPAGDIDRLRELGIPVLVVYAPTVDVVMADIRLIGRAIGADEEATAITNGMARRVGEVHAAVFDLPRPRVFYEIGAEPEIYGPAPGSFIADMIDLAGGSAITTGDPNVYAISVERLVDEDPEVIVLGDAAYGVCPPGVAARAGWGGMTAVTTGAVRAVDDTIVTRPGPRLAEGLAALALAIHPEAAITPPAGAPAYCAQQ